MLPQSRGAVVARGEYNYRFDNGMRAFAEACGQRCRRLGREKDHEHFLRLLLTGLASFANVQNYLPFLELTRKALKGERAKGKAMPDDFAVLRGVNSAIEIHCLIESGSWTQAAIMMMNLSTTRLLPENEGLFNAMPMRCKARFLEFAAVIIFLLKFRVAYLPDYALSYIDFYADHFTKFYNEEDAELMRKNSQLRRQGSLARQASKEEAKREQSLTLGRGRKTNAAGSDDAYNDDYYDEMLTYKREDQAAEDDYYDEEEEDETRKLIEFAVKGSDRVEKPDAELLQALYEQVLSKLIELTETINEDSLAFIYKIEYQRIYNLLMASVVNDTEKTPKVCQLLGQGFNRLMRSPLDDFFLELGVPDEWSSSSHAQTLTAATFSEQMQQFRDEADPGLHWQWFSDFETKEFEVHDQVATGLFVAKIDITAGQTDQAQEVISANAVKARNEEQRRLALRLASARRITRAIRGKLDKVKNQEAEASKRREASLPELDKVAGASKERLSSITSHARVNRLDALLQLSQVNPVVFIERLQAAYARVNYLQELMVVKAFSNSIEITKAITFMNELRHLHADFCERAQLFAREQGDILNSFDLMDQGDSPLKPIFTDLCVQLESLEMRVQAWQTYVFEGRSSGFAISKILDSHLATQQRLRLKWQKMKPSSKRARLALFKKEVIRRFDK